MSFEELSPTHAWTGSGYIDIANPDPDAILISDIATGLSREPRYGGSATRVKWTVGQHSLMCLEFARADGVTDRLDLAAVLMHDAPEYMLRDMIAPAKTLMPCYRELEQLWWSVIAAKWGLPETLPPIVKHYDRLAASSEKKALISSRSGPWGGVWPEPRDLPSWLLNASDADVETYFLEEAVDTLGIRHNFAEFSPNVRARHTFHTFSQAGG